MNKTFMLSDFGNRLLINWKPYKGIDKLSKIPRELHEEFCAWETTNKSIKRWIELAKVTEALKYHLKSK